MENNVKIKTITDKTDKQKTHLTLTCEYCGEPINVTSEYFGMDCKNHCSEKAFKKQGKV